MPAGQVIGRVSVKVLPDTDDFRRTAQKDLDRIEKTLKMVVPTRIDMSGASKEYLAELRKINQRNRALDSRKIRFATTISTDGMNEEISKAVRRLNERADARKVKFKADVVAAVAEVEIDKESLKKVKKQLDDWRKDNSPIKIDVELQMSRGAAAGVNARLSYLSRARTASIIPTLDKRGVAEVATALAALSGGRAVSDIFDNLGRSLRNLDRNVPIIGTLALAVSGLATMGLTAASNLFALSASLAQIGPLALALPGLLGGIAIGLGITVAAFKDFNTIFPDVKAKLTDLQNVLSTNFWAGAEAPMRTMIDTLLPLFSAGVADAATHIGNFFGGLAGALSTSFAPLLTAMFDNLGESVRVFTDATPAIANIFAILANTGAGELPELAKWLTEVLTRFSNFLTAASKDGRLDQWISDAKAAFVDLGRVIGNLFGILAGLARAATAAGGSTLGIFADTLERIKGTVNSPEFQSTLTNVFKSAHQAMSLLATQSGPAVEAFFNAFGGTVAKVLPIAGKAIGQLLEAVANALSSPAIQNGLVTLFSMIGDAVSALAPAFGPLAQAIGALAPIIGTLAVIIARILTAAFIPLSQVITTLAPAIQPLIAVLGQGLLQVVAALAPVITQLATVFASLISGGILPAITSIIAALVPVFAALLTALLPIVEALVVSFAPVLVVLAQALAVVLTALTPLIVVMAQLLSAILLPLAEGFAALATDALPKVAEALSRFVAALVPVIAAIVTLVGYIMPVLVPVLSFLANLILSSIVMAVNGASLVLEGFKGIFQGVFTFISGILSIFSGDFQKGFGQLWDGCKQILQGAWNVILGAFEVIINLGFLGAVRKGFVVIKEGFALGWAGIKALLDLVWGELKTNFEKLMTDLAAAPAGALNLIKAAFSDAWAIIKSAVDLAWTGIKDAFTLGITNVVTAMAKLGTAILDVTKGFPGLLKDAGVKLIEGLINGITSKFGAVQSKLKSLTDKLPDWKGPAPKDKTLLFKAGELVIDGFIDGLVSNFGSVQKALKDVTALIPLIVSKNLKAYLLDATSELKKMSAEYPAVIKQLKDAQSALSDLQKTAADYASSIRDAINATGDFTTFDDTSFNGVLGGLTTARDAAKEFAEVLGQLKTAGLNQRAIDMIAQAGPKSLTVAKSIRDAGALGIAEVNRLQGEIDGFAAQAGTIGADSMYGAGIEMAKGLVQGLEDSKAALEGSMLGIAGSMVEAIKKGLDIHSPSREMFKVGVFSTKGLIKGVLDEKKNVNRAMGSISDDMVDTSIKLPLNKSVAPASSIVSGALDQSGGGTRILNYYAAPGSSISAEEDLFAAANRGRMGW